MKEDIVETLEHMVDKHGLFHVLVSLEAMCLEKAEHVSSNWQDAQLTKAWTQRANLLRKSAERIDRLGGDL